ncbi:c-type cytochrome [Parapedobacter sp. DT-150]|uniref:c-type cytochrome n=1 Tax=Parapedobacter sp. DT-150 TaxID=3396162 RepID=UPI003F1ABE65
MAVLLAAAMFAFAQQPQRKTDTVVKDVAPQTMVAGKAIYVKYCMACHQADGGGVPNLNPPLIKTTYVLDDKVRLIKIIVNGLDEEVEIDGEYYANPMPQLDILTDQEIADVLTYVRNSFGNTASAVTPAEVKKVRTSNSPKNP